MFKDAELSSANVYLGHLPCFATTQASYCWFTICIYMHIHTCPHDIPLMSILLHCTPFYSIVCHCSRYIEWIVYPYIHVTNMKHPEFTPHCRAEHPLGVSVQISAISFLSRVVRDFVFSDNSGPSNLVKLLH